MSGSSPRIIVFDIETLPNLNEALKVWPGMSQWPGLTLRAQISSVCIFGWKVLGSDDVEAFHAWDDPTWDSDVNDDRALVLKAYEVLKSADAVISHNGKSFDWKFLQTRLLIHGFSPLPKVPNADTKCLMKQNLYAFNNKLNNGAELLTDVRKMDHGLGWDLWVRTHGRDREAMDIMSVYCKADVTATEKLFMRLRPFVTNIPNHNLFGFGIQKVCPTCGSTRLGSDGLRTTSTGTYRRLICSDCGSRSKEPMNKNTPRAL